MIGLDNLTKKQKEVLRQMVLFTCQECGLHEDEVGTLEIHRLTRETHGGKYTPNNCKVVCSECHKMYGGNEQSNVQGK